MPRSKTGARRQKFSKESLNNAIKAIKDGRSLRDAAVEFSISKSTLWNYFKANKLSGNETVNVSLRKNDTDKVFTEEQEEELATYLDKAARLHYGLSKNAARSLAYEYANVNKIKCPEKWKEEKTAGKEWIRGFFKRFPRLSIRKPEATSLARSTSFNKANVKTFLTTISLYLVVMISAPITFTTLMRQEIQLFTLFKKL